MAEYRKIDWNDDWIINNYTGLCDDEFVKKYNEHVTEYVSKDTLRHHIAKKLKLKTEYRYNEEQKEFIKEHYSKIGLIKTTSLFNKTFNTNKDKYSIYKIASRLGLSVDKEVALQNANPNTYPIGSIREEPSTGYLVIKTGKSYKSWMKYQRYIWEQHHGKLPKDYVVIFLDNNIRNFDIDNLMAVPRDYCVIMNSNKIRGCTPELTKTAIKWCELYSMIKKTGNRVLIQSG